MNDIESKELEEKLMAAGVAKIDIENAKEALIHLGMALGKVCETICNMWNMTCEVVEEMIAVLTKKTLEVPEDREDYRLVFTRPRIQHQVLCRKPKRLIKKIIH